MFVTKYCKGTIDQILWDEAKVMFRGKFTALISCIRKKNY